MQAEAPTDLIDRVSTTAGISNDDAARIIAEVLDHLSEPVERYATRRHRELHNLGLKNDRIWPALAEEIAQRRFPAPQLDQRQARRMKYRLTRRQGASPMCGVVGYVGARNITVLLEGLGAWSTAAMTPPASRSPAARRPSACAQRDAYVISPRPWHVTCPRAAAAPGIGHARWATHGAVTETNCHPHSGGQQRPHRCHTQRHHQNTDRIHAGLEARGITLVTETDTEVLAHRIAEELAIDGRSLEDATRVVLRRVEGTYGLVVMDAQHPDQLVVARNGSPVLLGVGNGEMFVASNASAVVRPRSRSSTSTTERWRRSRPAVPHLHLAAVRTQTTRSRSKRTTATGTSTASTTA